MAFPTQKEFRDANKGVKTFRNAEREAQSRYNIPLTAAGRDYITRGDINWQEYRSNYDKIFGKKNV